MFITITSLVKQLIKNKRNMKKLIFLFAAVLIMCSCESSPLMVEAQTRAFTITKSQYGDAVTGIYLGRTDVKELYLQTIAIDSLQESNIILNTLYKESVENNSELVANKIAFYEANERLWEGRRDCPPTLKYLQFTIEVRVDYDVHNSSVLSYTQYYDMELKQWLNRIDVKKL